VIGDSCTDVYNYGTCTRLSPEAPVPVVKLSYSEEKPGMALNVEKNLKAFGHETLILTNRENIVKERFVDQTTMQHLLRVDRGEEKELEPMFIGLLKTVGNMSFDYDCVVISDYNKGFLTHEKCKELIKELSKRKVKIFVDSKKKDLSCYSECIIKVNKEEFEEMEVLPLNSEIIVTLGAEGARWRENLFPVESTNVFDVCGAGDTFMASFVTALMSTDSFEESIKFANKCAGISVKKFGNYTISLKDLDDL
jgi:D-beta-D-heptose 7-phosphate kinase/D-beta-D-heptose 1-phosphate adenosyltransferase